MRLTTRDGVEPFVTKDGSEIRELMHPRSHDSRRQSLAEATVPPRGATTLHRHHVTEEIYHILGGNGVMSLGEERFSVSRGDTVCIRPGTPHRIENPGLEPLILLCACSPAYSDEDTELME